MTNIAIKGTNLEIVGLADWSKKGKYVKLSKYVKLQTKIVFFQRNLSKSENM